MAASDARNQLFDPAERLLLRDGPSALTAGGHRGGERGEGVLHRHFADFDAFLSELVADRIGRLGDHAVARCRSAGTETANLTRAVTAVFGSVALVIVGLVISREALRERLRQTTPVGVPLLAEAVAMLASYLAAERELGRIAADADVETLALTLFGTGHLLFAGREATPIDPEVVGKVVTSVAGGRSQSGR